VTVKDASYLMAEQQHWLLVSQGNVLHSVVHVDISQSQADHQTTSHEAL